SAALASDGPTTRLTVSRSSNGMSWGPPVVAAEAVAGGGGDDEPNPGVAFDKEWIACDNGVASGDRGRCYLAYTDTVRGSVLGVISSSDGGLTWSPPVEVPVDDIVGAFAVIRPHGELVLRFLLQGDLDDVVLSGSRVRA